MRITDTNRAQATGGRRTEKRGDATGASPFSSLLQTGDAPDASATTGAGPVAAVGALIALQQVDDAAHGRSRGLQRGRDLLDSLEQIQRGLLTGTLSVTQLQSIAARLRAHESVADPQLSEIMSEIELRVAVELAKLGVETVL